MAKINLYHLSPVNLHDQILQPRIPTNFMTKKGFEDNKTKRISVCPTIDGCLRAMSYNLTGKDFFVLVPTGTFDAITPSTMQVPDALLTGEKWILKPVKMRCIGRIRVISDSGEDGIQYTYGNGKYTAELYNWNWSWLHDSCK